MPPSQTQTSLHSIIGQEKAKLFLTRAVRAGKMSHAYLFRGPAGIGKRSTALAFAAYLNCLNRTDDDACGTCRQCRKFASGNHPDLLLIEPDGSAIKIDQIRSLKKDLLFPPLEAQCRVVVLTSIHTMRREATNSLLKTLEEPPDNTVLILTADAAGEILPTIRSRCQTIPFYPLPYNQVINYLLSRPKRAGRAADSISVTEAETLAAIAEGSIGRAMLFKEKDILALRHEIVTRLLPLQPGEPEAVDTVFSLAEQAAKLENHLPELFILLKIWLRDLILLANGMPETSLISRDLATSLALAGQRFNLQQLKDQLHHIDRAEKQLKRNCNRGLVCEVLFFGLL